jgi:hypothetical protein
VGGSAAAAEGSDWQAEAALLYYGELGRVTAIEPVLNLERAWSAEHRASATLVLDALGGASHNGAAVVSSAQAFTGSSGGVDDEDGGVQTFAAGEVPLIRGFEDFRMALDLAYVQPINTPLNRVSLGSSLSKEEDYLSIGFNGALATELFSRNTKISLGGGGSYDQISPDGGIPQVLGDSILAVSTLDGDEKWVGDLSLGLTQVINKISIVQLNYNYGRSSGYHNDPYKIISRLDAAGVPVDYLNESRPEERVKQSLYGALKLALGAHSVTGSYRYYWDDWAVVAQTVDGLLRFNLSDSLYLEGHGRWHRQSKAEFYQLWLASADSVPLFASADHRLGDLQTRTLGLNVGYKLDGSLAFALRTEWYHQSDPVTANKAAQLDAVISQLSFSLGF